MPVDRGRAVKLAPVDTWPDLRMTVHLLPWTWQWRPSFYVDDVDGWRGHWSAGWLGLDVEWYGNKRLFTEARSPAPNVGSGAPS